MSSKVPSGSGEGLMKQAYEKADGGNVQYVELTSGNHYAINDWNPVSAPHQVSSESPDSSQKQGHCSMMIECLK